MTQKSEEFEMIAKTFQGLENILAEELTTIGAKNIQIGRRMVAFTGDKQMMYKANFYLRTAIRILKPIKHFNAKDADEVYQQVQTIHWEDYLTTEKTFAIDAVVYSEEFRHSKFVSYKVKDAIADYFREKTGKRPSVHLTKPDIQLNMHISETACTLSLDSSGESLHRRGYRQEAVEAPLNEVLAAGMIMLTGWKGDCDLIDPMSGSGTIPIEAALIARNIAPGIFRKEFAFERWPDFDPEMLEAIYNDESNERPFEHKIYAYDNDPMAISIATENVKAAGVSKDVALKLQPIQHFEQPSEKAIMITNPPYGERMSSENLLGLYQTIGERLKHGFINNVAWIISYRDECFDQIGLKASEKIPLYNGQLECSFRKYEIFDGKYNIMKADEVKNGIYKEDEKDAPKPRKFDAYPENHGYKKTYKDRDSRKSEDKPWNKFGDKREERRDDRDTDVFRSFRTNKIVRFDKRPRIHIKPKSDQTNTTEIAPGTDQQIIDNTDKGEKGKGNEEK
ncbi:MAG: THUMP domain-containing protein [Bacteroidaceae bacterium]